MRIDAFIDNPVISNQQEYYNLMEALEEVEPNCKTVELRQERLIIENVSRRTFIYPRNPSIDWVAGRLRYMVEKGL